MLNAYGPPELKPLSNLSVTEGVKTIQEHILDSTQRKFKKLPLSLLLNSKVCMTHRDIAKRIGASFQDFNLFIHASINNDLISNPALIKELEPIHFMPATSKS